MPIDFAAAMLSEANIGAAASHVLNKYLPTFISKRIMPLEEQIYHGELANDNLPPTLLSM